jgi:hypothetical protein
MEMEMESFTNRWGSAVEIQAVARGYFIRKWFNRSWGDEDDEDEDSRITVADLLRVPFTVPVPFTIIDPAVNCRIPNGGIWVNDEEDNSGPRKINECPICHGNDIIIRRDSGLGMLDENVYCTGCQSYLGVGL